jgi:hypothetical protein
VCCALSLLVAGALGPAPAEAQSLIRGVDEWARATTQEAQAKWVGPRVDYPQPRARPPSAGHLDSALWPLSVHAAPGVPAARLERVLAAAEAAQTLLSLTGWAESFGDGGQGGTGGHDLYLVDAGAEEGARAFLDATQPVWWGLDAGRAFALLDARLPEERLVPCTTQALAESFLYELDPAEAPSVRESSAAYLTWLITGELGCSGDGAERSARLERAPMGQTGGERGAGWLALLGQRQDLNTGVFLRDVWQLARQRTWEGRGLRASPDLYEAIAAALTSRGEQFENVAAELAERQGLLLLAECAGDARDSAGEPAPPRSGTGCSSEIDVHRLAFTALPLKLPPAEPALEPLGSRYLAVELDAPPQDQRLRVWLRGEFGTRWALTATALDAQGRVVGRLSSPPRKNPNSFLSLELAPSAARVLVAVTNLANGFPDADPGSPFEVHSMTLTLDRGRSGGEPELAP